MSGAGNVEGSHTPAFEPFSLDQGRLNVMWGSAAAHIRLLAESLRAPPRHRTDDVLNKYIKLISWIKRYNEPRWLNQIQVPLFQVSHILQVQSPPYMHTQQLVLSPRLALIQEKGPKIFLLLEIL